MECGAEMRVTTEPIVEQYKGVTITANNNEHYVCDACGEYELGPTAADELSRQMVLRMKCGRNRRDPTPGGRSLS
jgi:YgiT-type zinc finger domain-containing protein